MLQEMLTRHPALQVCAGELRRAIDMLCASYAHGGKVLTCGNGGSAADAEHIVGELMKGFLCKRALPTDAQAELMRQGEAGAYLAQHLQAPLPAISLVSSVSLATAFANDVAPELTFAQQVYGLGTPGDVLIGISTSGTSKNIVYAVLAAKARGVHTIGLTGGTGGALKALCDITICAPSSCTPDIQEYHLPLYHCLCEEVEAHFFHDRR